MVNMVFGRSAAVVGFAFGTLFAVSAPLTTDCFGITHFGAISGLVFTVYGFVAGPLGPLAGRASARRHPGKFPGRLHLSRNLLLCLGPADSVRQATEEGVGGLKGVSFDISILMKPWEDFNPRNNCLNKNAILSCFNSSSSYCFFSENYFVKLGAFGGVFPFRCLW